MHILAEAFNQTARVGKTNRGKIYSPLKADSGALIHYPVKVSGDLKKNNAFYCLIFQAVFHYGVDKRDYVLKIYENGFILQKSNRSA